MAKILFVWELGAGAGHISPYVKLVSRLQEKGHKIGFVLRHLNQADNIFRGSGVKWYQSPVVFPHYVGGLNPFNTYAKVLYKAGGYDQTSRLSGVIAAWRNLFDLIAPDLIVFDYSPTAMLATRDMQVGRIAIGTGFHLPPDARPVPSLPIHGFESTGGDNDDHDELLEFENKLLDSINEALELNGLRPLSRFTELLHADKTILRTFAELDHYGRREGATYAGIMKSPPGDIPEWPSIAGPKIFAYLKPFKALPMLLETLNRKRYPTLLYGDNIPQDILHKAASETLRIVDRPLDMGVVGKQADAVICNAGHGTVTEMLLSGVPLLMLPLQGEQYIVSVRVEEMGAGLSALVPEVLEEKLDSILNIPGFRESAKRFAQSYSGFNEEILLNTTIETIDSLLPG